VCLLVVAFQVVPGTPLLIGANRDEMLSRPAMAMTVLRSEGPRILGGRDEQSGGTWLAVNEHGVFAGLTNQPRAEGRDETRRSRGELPLALASATDAGRGVDDLLATHRPSDYNGSWLLTGDRDSLFFLDFTGAGERTAVPLAPGLYVLENRPLGAPSAKVDHVVAALGTLDDPEATLRRLLTDHTDPAPPSHAEEGEGDRPRAAANCVHLDGYGTRSSCIVRYGDDPTRPPAVWVADGAPCTAPFVDVSAWWTAAAPTPR
jgi:uncharacterized protein with NRDE domain